MTTLEETYCKKYRSFENDDLWNLRCAFYEKLFDLLAEWQRENFAINKECKIIENDLIANINAIEKVLQVYPGSLRDQMSEKEG